MAEPRCTPRGVRIPVTAVKGRRPRPLDDGGPFHLRGWHRSSVAVAPSPGRCRAALRYGARHVSGGGGRGRDDLGRARGCSGGGSAVHAVRRRAGLPVARAARADRQSVAARRRRPTRMRSTRRCGQRSPSTCARRKRLRTTVPARLRADVDRMITAAQAASLHRRRRRPLGHRRLRALGVQVEC